MEEKIDILESTEFEQKLYLVNVDQNLGLLIFNNFSEELLKSLHFAESASACQHTNLHAK